MTGETPDEWLLAEHDRRADLPYRDASITHHVREMFEVLADVPRTPLGQDVLSGSARWPGPHLHNDLDALDEAARNLAARRAERTQGIAI